MKDALKKLRYIYLPFLIIAISYIILYTFLNWLLIIKLNLISIRYDILHYVLPMVLIWVPILLWLRPRIRLIEIDSGNNNRVDALYQLIAAMAIAIPTILAQDYIETASGELTKLDNISQITEYEQTKYYTLNDYYIDRFNIGIFNSFEVIGKNNENFKMSIYVVMPILRHPSDTNNTTCFAWLGINYSEQISNDLDANEKEKQFQAFAKKSQQNFEKRNVAQFKYIDRVGKNTDDYDGYMQAIRLNPKYKSNIDAVFLPVKEPFEERNGDKFGWIFGALGIGGIIWLIMIVAAGFDKTALNKFEKGKPIKDSELKDFIEFLKPREGYFITPIIIYLNILIFIFMAFAGLGFISFKSQDLFALGANYRPSIVNGEWWRLLTSTFLHGGLMHLLANMYGLLFVGIFLEPLLGKTKYLTIYILTGILASCASIWWYDATISVGASGAIFGLYGLFLSLLLLKIFPPDFSRAFLISTLIFIGYNLLMGLAGGIDNAAHIGGLISGFIIGLILVPSLKNESQNENDNRNTLLKKSVLICLLSIIIIVFGIIFYRLVAFVNNDNYQDRLSSEHNQQNLQDSSKIDYYTKIIEDNPKNDTAYFNRGQAKQNLKDLNGAIEDYSKAIEINPKYIEAYCNRGVVKDDLQDFTGAMADYNKAIEIDSTRIEPFFNRGILKNQLHDYTGAIEDYDKAIEIDTKSALAYFNRGISKKNLQDYESALADYNVSLRIDPNYVDGYINRGNTKDALQDYKGAIADYEMAIKLNPKDALCWYNRGLTKMNLGDYSGAIDDFDKTIQIDSTYIGAFNYRGQSKGITKDFKGAISDFNKTIEIDPQYYDGYNNRGFTKSILKDYYGAIEDYNKAIEINPNYSIAYCNRGLAKIELGQKDSGCLDFFNASKLGNEAADNFMKEHCSK